MAETRRERRKSLGYPATIVAPDMSPVPCVLMDISNSGARLGCKLELPGEFTLKLSANGAARDCIVMWRRDDEVGVRFTKKTSVEMPQPAPAAPVSAPAAADPPDHETVLI